MKLNPIDMNDSVKPALIDKEQIIVLRFPEDEVLNSLDDISRRRSQLERATALGNTEKGKFAIVFEDDHGLKQVETTIWATTENCIVLKSGVTIPINRIHRIA